jgi:acyl-CoA thioesterase FadM
MVARHRRELSYGEPLEARTWVRDFRRGILSRREVRLHGRDGEPFFAATQHWAHVRADLKPMRGSEALLQAFLPVAVEDPEVTLPIVPRADGPEHTFTFEVWHTWMDPLAHVNHPTYVDFCDEAVARVLARAGRDPHDLIPVAEKVSWKGGAVAGHRVTVTTRAQPDGDMGRFEHRLTLPDGSLLAEATTLRRLRGAPDLSWLSAFLQG